MYIFYVFIPWKIKKIINITIIRFIIRGKISYVQVHICCSLNCTVQCTHSNHEDIFILLSQKCYCWYTFICLFNTEWIIREKDGKFISNSLMGALWIVIKQAWFHGWKTSHYTYNEIYPAGSCKPKLHNSKVYRVDQQKGVWKMLNDDLHKSAI